MTYNQIIDLFFDTESFYISRMRRQERDQLLKSFYYSNWLRSNTLTKKQAENLSVFFSTLPPNKILFLYTQLSGQALIAVHGTQVGSQFWGPWFVDATEELTRAEVVDVNRFLSEKRRELAVEMEIPVIIDEHGMYSFVNIHYRTNNPVKLDELQTFLESYKKEK